MNIRMTLPIEDVIHEIKTTLRAHRYTVLQAPPGAGKTTLAPLALLNENWLAGKKIVMLEPRRIAARAAAGRMADLICEPVGKTVGYHIRMDRCTSPKTRIEVVTEGILTRRIQNDPALEDIGLLIFDEFHERNLNSDLGLAFALESSEVFCPELRILVMSATIDSEAVSALMGNAPVIRSEGKSWPVETRYVSVSPDIIRPARMAKECFAIIQQAIAAEAGDILVFLPGVGEIKRTETLLNESLRNRAVTVIPLYGHLHKKEQDIAISPSKKGQRKIVLATSIAETSITIEGISIVIDSGFMRVPRYYSGTGMSRLETIPVSKSSANQRRGRAGRTTTGICYRMWAENKHSLLKEFNTPEIMNTDLTGFVLELALWGASEISDLKFLTQPPDSTIRQANSLLKLFGALDKNGRITGHGKKMARTGIHPRLAHMLIKGNTLGQGSLACHIAALLSERDFLFFNNAPREADITLRLEIMRQIQSGKRFYDKNITLNMGILERIMKNAAKFAKMLDTDHTLPDPKQAGFVLALAYPERIMQLRGGTDATYLMASGKGAFFLPDDSLARTEYAVGAELDGSPGNSKIYLGAPYSKEALRSDFADNIETMERIQWEKQSQSVIAQKETKYGALVLEREMIHKIDPERIAAQMITGIRQMGLECLPWTRSLKNLQARAVFLFKTGNYPTLPDLTDTTLTATLDIWLKPFLNGISKASHLTNLDLKAALGAMLTWENQKLLTRDAPEKITVPSGSSITLQYPESESGPPAPILAVRLQELFGLEETPRVANGVVPVMIHLLSPAMRPVQVTSDLKNFWQTTYPEVKKELMGRYPKHYWPEDPFKAVATRKTKKGMQV